MSLTPFKEKLIKIGAKVDSHGRSHAFQIAEVAISWHLFAGILQPIAEPRPPPEVVVQSMPVTFPGKKARP